MSHDPPDVEVWYAVEFRMTDGDGWYTADSRAYDTIKAAREYIKRQYSGPRSFQFRVVRKTLITEVVGS